MSSRSILFILLSVVFFNRCALLSNNTRHPELVDSYEASLKILHRSCFTVGYDEYRKHAAYVRYLITPSDLDGKGERKNNFQPDPLVIPQFSASDDDYYKSGFDRGHLCPAADMTQSQECMDESFFYSNISPQVPGFNRGIWKKLESKVREWCQNSDSLIINTGPIFNKNDTLLGPNRITVPQAYFKTILRYQNETITMIGFILSNNKSSLPLTEFIVTPDEVEDKTSLDFYKYLTDSLETRLESEKKPNNWF